MAYNIDVIGPMVIAEGGGGSEKIIDQVESSSLAMNPNKNIKSSAGDVDPTFACYGGFAPQFRSSTEAIAQFLAAVGISGLVISANPTSLYNRGVDLTTGLRKGSSAHQKFAMNAGLIVPRQLTVGVQTPARISFDVIGVNAAGSTNPVTKSESVSLPVMNGVAEQFYFGKAMINGSELEGVQDYTYDFGLSAVVKQGAGALYPQLIYIESRRPKLMFRVNDAEALADLGLTGLAQGSTDSIVYLRKAAANGIRVADATTEHVSLAVDDGIITVPDKGGSHPSELSTSVEIDPIFDGANAIVVVSTATAIP